ncbi:MAG: excinuclease ABC subunit UvrC [Planctomycetota bacterium]|nr:excinuclease ABC subunit UvrC [Planctomycetota bacterium]
MSTLAWSSAADLAQVPERPGVYLFRDEGGTVLYVGKAANLRSRLRSYRSGGDGRIMIRFLEAEARSVETIVTRTEQEALLLEDTLIKTHKPLHNVRLKDDKSFRMLRLDLGERFPRLKHVRARNPDVGKEGGRSRYFGPFASSSALRRTLSDLHRVVPLRDCPDSVMNHRSRPCLKHQIGLCVAPCVGLVDERAYAELVDKASRVLSGETQELELDLTLRMRQAAESMEYERAAGWRDRLGALRRTVERQGVQSKDKVRRDVLGLVRRGEDAVVHRLSFREGNLSESRSHTFRSQLSDEELMHVVVTALYGNEMREKPAEIVLPCEPNERELLEHVIGENTVLVVPKSGEARRMLEMAFENARAELTRRDAETSREEEALEQLVELLDLETSPEVIDCFDISNMQGSNVVASRVRFRSGHADRAGYRRFKVRGVEGQDDFASMKEVVGRSLKRGVTEGDLPTLVVIDGGAAQLASALEAREEAGAWDVAMVGLAKARSERKVKGVTKEKSEERVFVPGAKEPIELPRHSAARHLLERIRDEAHRFAITYHRKERGKITSRLDSIPGVGAAKRKALLRAFGSAKGVEQASIEAISSIAGIGPDLARKILDSLRGA